MEYDKNDSITGTCMPEVVCESGLIIKEMFGMSQEDKTFFMLELLIVMNLGIMEFSNIITKNSNDTSATFMQENRCGRRDLNPGNGLGRPAYYQAILRPHKIEASVAYIKMVFSYSYKVRATTT
jgi:hypothetical protein